MRKFWFWVYCGDRDVMFIAVVVSTYHERLGVFGC